MTKRKAESRMNITALAHLDNEATAYERPVEVVGRASTHRFWECVDAITRQRLFVFEQKLQLPDGRPWPYGWHGEHARLACDATRPRVACLDSDPAHSTAPEAGALPEAGGS